MRRLVMLLLATLMVALLASVATAAEKPIVVERWNARVMVEEPIVVE